MCRSALRRTFLTAGLAALLGTGGCTPLDDAMVAIFGRSMRDQSTFDPYEDPRSAPEGSVSFASGNYPARPGEVNVGQPESLVEVPPPFTELDVLNEVDAVVNLPNPVDPTEESVERGEELFLRFCAPCHGPNGSGASGYIITAGYPPYALTVQRVIDFTDGYLYGMVRAGRGNMPAYGDRISHFDRWNIVNYLRVLQGVAETPPAPVGTSDDPSSGG